MPVGKGDSIARYGSDGTPGTGRCVARADACFELKNNVYVLAARLDCEAADGGAADPGDPGFAPVKDGTTSSSGTAKPSDDSGCASSPGSVSSAFALLGAPLALGLLLARRKRRR